MKLNIFCKFLILCLFMGAVFSCQNKDFVNVKAFYYDVLSHRALELKQKDIAHEAVLKALENQDEALLKSNLGITFDLLEKRIDAEKSLLSALNQAVTDEEKFKYQFNLGVLLGAQKKIPEALNYYQGALDIVPTSIETKHNIELLIQQQKQDQKDDKEKSDKEDKEKKDGEGQGKSDPKEDQKEGKDKKDDKPNDKDDKKDPKNKDQDRKSNVKYKPRPFKGDQLSEGDVKKILGELSQQDQKIRSNFNKKEQPKEDKNEKDW